MIVGTLANGDEVWAHVFVPFGDRVVCDRAHRAFVLFQAKNRQGALVRCLSSLEEIEWDGYIAGECEGIIARWCFVYDALVAELKADVE